MPSQYEIDKKAKLEAAKIMQVKHNIIETDESNQGVEPMKPKTFKQKWKNYWYHYKFHTLVTLFILVFVSSLLHNKIFPNHYDVGLVIVSERTFEGSEPIIEDSVSDMLIDYDKDGEKEIKIVTLIIEATKKSTETAQMLEGNRANLIGLVSAKETFLYIVDKGCYDEMVDMGVQFKDLNEIASNDHIQGDKYDLTDSQVSKKLGLNKLLDGMYLCLVDFDSFDQKVQKKDKIKQAYENEKDFLLRLISLDS